MPANPDILRVWHDAAVADLEVGAWYLLVVIVFVGIPAALWWAGSKVWARLRRT